MNMKTEDKNTIIEECIKVVKRHVNSNCDDHTPYYGACVSCGRHDNPDIVDDIDDLLDDLNNLKTDK